MTDYTQNVFFGPKDSLTPGDPAKKIKGTEFDGEFSELATAISSKENTSNKGAASGYAPLDGSTKVALTYLYDASETVRGIAELATVAEATTGTDTSRITTPAGVKAVVDALRNGGAGLVGDFETMTNPGADRILFWDFSIGSAGYLTVSTGLTLSGTTLSINAAQIETSVNHDNLIGFVANEHIDHSLVSVTAGNGLTGGGAINASVTLNVGAGSGIVVGADSVGIDLSALTSVQGNTAVATDSYLFNDGGVVKQITHQNAGLPVSSNAGTAITLASTDFNRFLQCTAATAVTVTLNTSVGVVGNIILIQQAGAGQVTIAGTATKQAAVGLKTRTQYSVIALLCVAANTWVVYGDAAA